MCIMMRWGLESERPVGCSCVYFWVSHRGRLTQVVKLFRVGGGIVSDSNYRECCHCGWRGEANKT